MPFLRRHWFLAAYLAVLAAAMAWPEPGSAGGVLRLDLLKTWCIAGIFCCAGLVLPSHKLLGAVQAWRTHALVQTLSFIVAPLLGLAIAWLAGLAGAPEAMQAGLLILACLPTTIGSCVALTGLAGGNQGIALVNSVLGNLLGLVVTPLLVTVLVGRSGSVPVGAVIGQLALVAALPVALGQLARLPAAPFLDRHRVRIGIASSVLLLTVLLGIFSELARSGLGSGAVLAALACLALHLVLAAAAWASAIGQVRADRIAITLTASQKTAALGIPLIGLLFAGEAALPLMLLPVVVYHIVQMIVGSVAASRLAGGK